MNKITFKESFQVEVGANPEMKRLLVALAQKHNPNIRFNCCDANDYKFLQFWVRNGMIDDITHDVRVYRGTIYGATLDKKNDISVESAIYLLTIGETPYVPVKVVLNSSHTAEVLENGDVKVGCQEFTAKAVMELAKAVEARLNK